MDVTALSNLELLARVIGKGRAAKLYQGSLAGLFAPEEEVSLDQEPLVAALELVRRWLLEELWREPVLSQPARVRDFLKVHFAGQEHESFVSIFLDAQHRLIAAEELFRGTLNQTSVYPREIVKRALQRNAAAVIFAHNHPSGVAEPSHADELLTRSLKQSLALVDVQVLDHFVLAGSTAISLAERGLV